MTESSADGFSARLRRLPGQFLLALVNATAILAIVAAVLVIVAIGKVQRVAANVSATLTDAVLSRVDADPAQFLSRLEGIEAEIGALTAALEELAEKDDSVLDPKIADLKAKLGDVEAGIDRLVDGRAALVDHAMSELGTAIGDAVRSLRHCPVPGGVDGAPEAGNGRKESGYPRVSYLPAGMTEGYSWGSTCDGGASELQQCNHEDARRKAFDNRPHGPRGPGLPLVEFTSLTAGGPVGLTATPPKRGESWV